MSKTNLERSLGMANCHIMPCGGQVSKIMVETSVGMVCGSVCAKCGEGYGVILGKETDIDTFQAQLPKIETDYCDGRSVADVLASI